LESALPKPYVMDDEASANGDQLPTVGDTVISTANRAYTVVSAIGEGSYGTVFLARSEKDWRRASTPFQQFFHKLAYNTTDLERRSITFFQGYEKGKFTFLVMSLLGPDLTKLRSQQPGRYFTLRSFSRNVACTNSFQQILLCSSIHVMFAEAARSIAVQTLSAIEELHQCGFISRDIKPGNFAVGNNEDCLGHIIFIFDFGLAKRFLDRYSRVIPSRGVTGWRGTVRYASLNAHRKHDLSRRDDMESWLYMIIELTKGSLPWQLITGIFFMIGENLDSLHNRSILFLPDKSIAEKAKKEARNTAKATFFENCPHQYEKILRIIDRLKFTETPPYAKFYQILGEVNHCKLFDCPRTLRTWTYCSLTAISFFGVTVIKIDLFLM
uniref:Protein kinase domain-containing protein n=1 Tax=Gongylonema pulchrum TaxID=637853 RepID=A0A183E069_9BILA